MLQVLEGTPPYSSITNSVGTFEASIDNTTHASLLANYSRWPHLLALIANTLVGQGARLRCNTPPVPQQQYIRKIRPGLI